MEHVPRELDPPRPSVTDDAPEGYDNLDELALTPISLQERQSGHRRSITSNPAESELLDEDIEAGVAGIDELAAPPPDENPREDRLGYHQSLEEERDIERRQSAKERPEERLPLREKLIVELYTTSWLIFFSLLGTLARLGVEWLGAYPNAPVTTKVIWANLGGSFVLGFLQEDRALFAEQRGPNLSSQSEPEKGHDKIQAEHLAVKKTLPLYIGLSVGFCGSFTSFSSFMRDAFLTLANDSAGKDNVVVPRSAGWSVCAVLAVVIIEVAVSLSALATGAHFAIALLPILSKLPKLNSAWYLNPLAVLFGYGSWLCVVFLAIWPPQNRWRGEVVFTIVFAPLGTLLRFFLSIKMNRLIASFPLGTFSSNIFGAAIIGLAYGLQHTSLQPAGREVGGGILGCQILEGIMEGFCGCLTTVSTWVAELRSLRKRHAYIYGVASIGVGLSLVIVICGSMTWTLGLSSPACHV
ncbi:CrcB-like protein-domain-containing protein [Lophiotrema nucula]|uniref:CrcB-like protein-domain-containing protein n=1 Tax=Lophiotrema nucula TaxID=690887 RepID=A0A6A5Z8E3_9PLEO|nr:CrcB-like protein-domain-containing protein [Lophiotrema nucula]